MTIPQQKNALRREIKVRASALSGERLRAWDAAICRALLSLGPLAAADVVFAFCPVSGEPDIRPVLEALLAQGKTLALPRCTAPGIMEARRVGNLEELTPGRYGIPEPGENCPVIPWETFSFAILPCVAADRMGNRLGHGGGYYDRFLAKAPPGMTAALVCRSALMPPAVPAEPHDIPVPLVVTEEGVWREGRFFPVSG